MPFARRQRAEQTQSEPFTLALQRPRKAGIHRRLRQQEMVSRIEGGVGDNQLFACAQNAPNAGGAAGREGAEDRAPQ